MTENSGTSSLSRLVIFLIVLACAATLVATALYLISDPPLQQKALTPPKNNGNDCGPGCDDMCNKKHVYQVRTCTELCENDPDIFSRELGVSGVGTGDCAAWCEANMFAICRNICLREPC
jgi:hypothetical protein